MIICSCNVLSETQVLETLKRGANIRPQSAAQAYRCLGCAPRCGRCLETVRALVAKAHLENCNVGCPTCPGHEGHGHVSTDDERIEAPLLIAAE
jgi:bacterioferritin-associated ferredoxin